MELLNITWLKVNKELKNLADMHPHQTYKLLFRNPAFRKSLLNYILKQIPNRFLLIDSEEDYSHIEQIVTLNYKDKQKVYALIHQRINQLRHHPMPTYLKSQRADCDSAYPIKQNT
jgi:hypothetical protein